MTVTLGRAASWPATSRRLGDYQRTGPWSRWSRAGIRRTAEELRAFTDDYLALVNRYAHPAGQEPPRARQPHLRLVAYPAPEDG
jgi:hypothetical protein